MTNHNINGEIDTSGTWTDGLVIGSPEWADASLAMDAIALRLQTDDSRIHLMGALDKSEGVSE